jgi:ParB family chromosome partitioning protein
MGEEARHRGLGRGLSALLSDEEPESVAAAEPNGRSPRTAPVAFLKPSRFQPRRNFEEEDLASLTASIREKGVLQPILVRPTGPDSYEIVAGERRWRAAQRAKLHEVPIIVRTLSDAEALELAIVENVQRADLSAIEEANAYQQLIQEFRYTQEQLSDVIGKSRSHIANTLRLLKLPDSVRALIASGKLTAGHARTLIGAPNAEAMAQEIVAGALNVRQAEKKAKAPKLGSQPGKAKRSHKDADTKALEHSLSSGLGMDVQIDHKGTKGGTVLVFYKTLEQLDEICRRLNTFVEVD